MKEPLEDNWHDIISKAAHGLQVDVTALTKGHWNEKNARELFEGICHPATLAAMASALHLDGNSLLAMTINHYHPGTIPTPKNFKRFTTSYHGIKVHSYLLWSHENQKAVAFDTGTDVAPLLETLEQYQLQLNTIFLTHGHGDHVAQLQKLIDVTGAPAWIDQHDLIAHAQALSPNYRYQLDSAITIEARSTPGHSLGGTTYVIHGISPTIAIVGDAIFAGSIGGIPPSSYQAALKAIQEKILSLHEETIIAPGHGPLTTVGDEKRYNPFFVQK
ncbi:MAG: MBL fold metallo-hydrolase [Verrucomicrobia bacterium]|nr:MBL fold metallo-hydrolase [Verrucomicrobiota bacterium]